MIQRKNRFAIMSVALILAVIFVLKIPADAIENSKPQYIKEVVISSSSSESKAKNWLIENGYAIVDADLNDGTAFDYVYLGFKTTTDRNEAITDISLMDMNGGYTTLNYGSFAEKNEGNIGQMVSRLLDARNEFRSNLNRGSCAAELALKYLNIFTVPESSEHLGDWMLDSNRSEAEFRRLILITNSLVTNIIYTYLSLGCSDSGKGSFAEVMSKNGPDTYERPSPGCDDLVDEYWDNKYYQNFSSARELYRVITAFTNDYDKAEERRKASGGSVNMENVSENGADDAIRKFSETGAVQNEEYSDAFILSAYAYLSQFSYVPANTSSENILIPESDNLGDFLLEIGHGGEGEDNISLLYPMVEALTPGQFAMLTVQGLTSFVSFITMDGEAYDNLDGLFESYRTGLYDALGSDDVSVWIGTNRNLFDTEIALTERAVRQAAAANDLDKLTEVTEFDMDIRVALCYVGGAAAASAGVTLLAVGLGSFVFHGFGATISAGLMTLSGAIAATVSGVAFGVIGAIGLAVTVLALAALLIVAVIYLVSCVSDMIDYFFPEYTEIPLLMYEKTEGGYIEYKAVTERGENPADINGGSGAKWNALYYTSDTRAGNPITADEEGNFFKVNIGIYQTPSGYLPVSHLGENTAFNLNTDTYIDLVGGIYLYFHSERTDKSSQNGKYLEELAIYCDKNSKVVRDKLLVEGYSVLNYNLTDDSEWATFIGYRTTDLESEAIRDIRVSWMSGGSTAYWGSINETYGLAGNTDVSISDDRTNIHISLYYSKGPSFGTPILSYDFGVVHKLGEIPEGCEGVNLFCGGMAFDFNTYDEEDEDGWRNHSYVYFRPSVSYTSGTEYVSGLVFVSGSTDMKPTGVLDFVREMGFTVITDKLCKGFLDDEDVTMLCMSKTYNPYRAITGIGAFTGEFNTKAFPDNAILDGVGYMSCQVFTQGDRNYYGNIFWGGYYRLIRPDHAYITTEEEYGGEDEYGDSMVTRRALYVCGPSAGMKPIEASDLICSSESKLPAQGFIGVHEMSDIYSSSAINLAMSDKDRHNSVYLYYPGTAKIPETYISSIKVVYSEDEDCSYNNCLLSLMGSGNGEIFRINLARPSGEDNWTWGDGSVTFPDDIDREDYDDGCAYLRVTRTKTKNDAIGSIIIYRVNEDDPIMPKTLNLPCDSNGNIAQYTCAGDCIYCEDAWYYIYYSKTGNKVTGLTIDSNVTIPGMVTALDQKRNLPTAIGLYIKTETNASLPYLSKISVASADVGNDIGAISNLLSQGCTDVMRYSASEYGGHRCVYIGFSRTSSTVKALKNLLVLSSSGGAQNTVNYSGSEYLICGVSLNSGLASVPAVYLYSTVDGDKNKALTDFFIGTAIPDKKLYGEEFCWEYALTVDGERADLTKGLFEVVRGGCDEDDKTTHTEHYLFMHHKDNARYSDSGIFASVFNDNPSLVSVVLLGGLLVMGGFITVLIRNKKKTV